VLKILTFSSLYPNNVDARHGIFVEQRLRQLSAAKPIRPLVVAPVPRVPLLGKVMPQVKGLERIDAETTRHGIPILYPRYYHIPKVGMTVAPLSMAMATIPVLAELKSRRHDFALIDAQYFYPDGVAAAIAARRLGVPYTITARGSDLNLIAQHAVPRRMIRWAARHAAAVITVSDALKGVFESLASGQRRVEVLPNGVDRSVFRPTNRAAARAAIGAGAGLLIVAVGNLLPVKRFELALEALALLPDARLLILGGGPELARLRRLAIEREVQSRVEIRAPVPQTELPMFYSAADVSLLCSAREGMPNVVLESIACGTPVAAVAVGGVAEVIKRPEAGLLIERASPPEIADAVRRLAAIAVSQSEVARCADEFSWERTVDRQFDLFSSIVAEQRRRGVSA